MPVGYLVSLGDAILDPGDAVTGSFLTFETDTSLGAGSVTFFNVTYNGTFFTEAFGNGTFILGTDGNVYFDPDFDETLLTSYSSAEVRTSPTFDGAIYGTTGDDAALSGTANDDLIYGGDDRDPTGTGNDTIDAGAGNDNVFGGDGSDSITGGAGSDTIDAGAGDDTVLGDGGGTPATVTEFLDWSEQGGDGTDLTNGFTQSTGRVDVTVSFSPDATNAPTFEVSTDAIYVDGGEPFDTTSSLALFGDGDGLTSTTTIDFATQGDETVENVSFRISDIDFFAGNHEDIITINAIDGDGNPVAVTITPSGDDTVSGNTITSGSTLDEPDEAAGSVLVEIAGPVAQITIGYSNGLNGTQLIHVSDIYYDIAPTFEDSLLGGTGNDSIDGGEGADTLRGGDDDDTLTGGAGADQLFGDAGNDSLIAGGGDTLEGGDGDDTFTFDPGELDGSAITIVGGEGDEGTGDTLDLSGVFVPGSITLTNTDDAAGGLSGTATLTDGTVVTFSEIETIICFTQGTAILTPSGERRIETLRAGDLVVTLDNGPQPVRWIGHKNRSGLGRPGPNSLPEGHRRQPS